MSSASTLAHGSSSLAIVLRAYRWLVADFGGPEGPRIDPWTLNVDRTLRRFRRICVVEERDEAGRWIERGRFGSYDEAAEALDRLGAGSEQDFRIREVNPRRWLRLVAAAVAAVVLLAAIAVFAYIIAG
jgi:hypothetical protein